MKKLFLQFAVCFLFLNVSLAQNNSMQIIYDGSFYGIKSFQDVKIYNEQKKSVYVQNGANFDSYVNSPNESGNYYKLNKNNNSWYIPHNGFLNSIWVWAWWENPPRLSSVPFRSIVVSSVDTNVVFKNAVYFVIGNVDPEEMNYMTANGGANFFNPLFDTYNPVYSSGCTYGGADIVTDLFGQNVVFIGYNWRYSFNNQQYRGVIENNSFFPMLTDTIPELKDVCNGGFIKISPFNNDFIFAVGEKMLLSTTAGYNFFSLNIPPLKFLEFDFSDHSIYGASTTKLYSSTSNGMSWDSLNLPFQPNTIEISPDSNNVLYAGADSGLYKSNNKGANWILYNNSFLPSKRVIGLSKDTATGDTLFVCTDKMVYKVWRDFLVNVKGDDEIMQSFSLGQNYPNPFNPSTTINYELRVSCYVSLKVYDALGKLVATLFNEKQNAGNYNYQFSTVNYQLPSGIYFYKLEAGDFTETKRMVLLK